MSLLPLSYPSPQFAQIPKRPPHSPLPNDDLEMMYCSTRLMCADTLGTLPGTGRPALASFMKYFCTRLATCSHMKQNIYLSTEIFLSLFLCKHNAQSYVDDYYQAGVKNKASKVRIT